jgi:hypothetical protein
MEKKASQLNQFTSSNPAPRLLPAGGLYLGSGLPGLGGLGHKKALKTDSLSRATSRTKASGVLAGGFFAGLPRVAVKPVALAKPPWPFGATSNHEIPCRAVREPPLRVDFHGKAGGYKNSFLMATRY